MKKSLSILSILVLLCVTPIFAQSDTLFVNDQGIPVPQSVASYFRILSKADSNLFEFKAYTLARQLRKVFHATSPQATVLQGEYIEYDASGNVSIHGHYSKGFKVGQWDYFYLNTNRKKEMQVYTTQHEYYSTQYDSLNRKIESEGAIDKYGKRTGCWRQFHFNSDSVKTISHFVVGKKEGIQYEYFKSGQVKRKELYQNNKLQKGELFDTTGKKVKYFQAFVYPQYRDYVSNYLQKNEPCTAEALKKNDFKVRFVVTKEGDVAEPKVINVEDEACVQKIKSALLQMKKWKPAMWENTPVKYTYETTIRLYVPRD